MGLDSVQLTTFAAVVNEGSFEAAARTLHVTSSAVSQRIKALEQVVGQVLVRRTKPCEATEAGQALLRLAGQVALLEHEALRAARGPLAGGAVRTRVAVVVNADSLATWFLAALTELPPEFTVTFDLREDDQDHTAELLRDGSVMAAVTAQNVPVQGCRVERLGAMRYLAVAAPRLATRHFPDGPASAAFAAAPMIALNRKDTLQHRFLNRVTRRRLDPPLHHVPSAWGFVEAVRLGLGWGLVPEQIALDDIAAGRCVELAPGRHLDVPLYWQHWRLDSAILNALTGAVQTAARSALR
ncbi:LysR family transcriptional regulator [Micromonospora pisi]|uniref:HTH-type transcriptional regulator LysG n=1 Tax=Micromonospora pisi TaxID=589240 RepID=A0A495JC17_9ACTN|nr:LysR family transcriptional regulator ArgP [Micromonospora pisi]RKR86363.1 LysR family transcriptional regulator [Micromonospora pisi]